ncbi:hypothetical protein TNCV_2553581 [Trichonephila clavipes]|nr:hypothetical protein TNCV_2553581 [Trichonephila clavipes]
MDSQFEENSLRNSCLAKMKLSFNYLQRGSRIVGRVPVSDRPSLWQTRTEWNEVVSDVFTFGMMTQRTAPWENWHLERGFELLRTFGLVRWGLGGSDHVEGTGEKLSFYVSGRQIVQEPGTA